MFNFNPTAIRKAANSIRYTLNRKDIATRLMLELVQHQAQSSADEHNTTDEILHSAQKIVQACHDALQANREWGQPLTGGYLTALLNHIWYYAGVLHKAAGPFTYGQITAGTRFNITGDDFTYRKTKAGVELVGGQHFYPHLAGNQTVEPC